MIISDRKVFSSPTVSVFAEALAEIGDVIDVEAQTHDGDFVRQKSAGDEVLDLQ